MITVLAVVHALLDAFVAEAFEPGTHLAVAGVLFGANVVLFGYDAWTGLETVGAASDWLLPVALPLLAFAYFGRRYLRAPDDGRSRGPTSETLH